MKQEHQKHDVPPSRSLNRFRPALPNMVALALVLSHSTGPWSVAYVCWRERVRRG